MAHVSPTGFKAWTCSPFIPQPCSAGSSPSRIYTGHRGHLRCNVCAAWPPCSGCSEERTNPHPNPSPTQAFLICLSALSWAPSLSHWKTSLPFSDCVKYTFLTLVFLHVGRNSHTIASSPANRGVGGKRVCLGVGGIYYFSPRWDPL